MSRDKQIEDMAFDICLLDNCKHLPQEECDLTTCAHCEAEALYNKGYRKASDVAREIFEEIERHIEDVGFSSFVERSEFKDWIAELKKKYESEGADDEKQKP